MQLFRKVDTQIPLSPRRVGILGCIKTEGSCTCVQQVCQSAGLIRRFPWRKPDWLQAWNKENDVSWCVLCLWSLYFTMCFRSIRINMIYHLICCRLLFTVSATLWVLSFISLTQAVLTGRWQFWWIKHAWTCNQTHCISASWHSKSVLWFSIFRTFFFPKNQWRTPTPKCFCYLSFVCWLRFALEGSPVPGCSSLESPSLTRGVLHLAIGEQSSWLSADSFLLSTNSEKELYCTRYWISCIALQDTFFKVEIFTQWRNG